MDTVVRHATVDDNRCFNTLIGDTGGMSLYRAIFGQFSFTGLVEYSFVSLVAMSGEGEDKACLGAISVNDNTTCSADPSTFDKAVNELSHMLPAHISNSLFINFWAVAEGCDPSIGHELIRKVFDFSPETDYVFWLCPTKARQSESMERYFKIVDTSKRPSIPVVDPLSGCNVFVVLRKDFLPRLHVREARVEDNDELLPILQKNNPQLLEGQESFFLADIISSQDDRNKFFVGVEKKDIVGMLATSLDVNVSLIMKIFEIDIFPDIITQKEPRPLPKPELIGLVGNIRQLKHVKMDMLAEKINILFVDAEKVLSSLDIAQPDEESASAAVTMLYAHIKTQLAKPEHSGDKTPLACVVVGFPRTDDEAVAISQQQFIFDAYVEIGTTEKDNVDEDDPFMQSHLDSVETLRQLAEEFTDPAHYINLNRWRRIVVGNDVQKELIIELSRAVEHRRREIELQRQKESEEPPKANAFAITVFCIEEDFLSRAEDLLRIAFEEHRHCDYCVFMVPCNNRPSRLTQNMITCPCRTGVSFDQTLFVIHRGSLLTHDLMEIVRLNEGHFPALERFVAPLSELQREEAMRVAAAAARENDVDLADNPAEVCFAVMIKKVIVCFVAVSRKIVTNDDVNWIRANYRIEDFISMDKHRLRAQASITQWIADPNHGKCTRYLLREIMRRYRKTLLYFQSEREVPPPREISEEMITVPPRSRAQYIRNEMNLAPLWYRPTPAAQTVESPLFFIAKAMLIRPKILVPTRVLILGGNPAAYPIIEALCMAPNIHIQNITFVVSEPPEAMDATRFTSPRPSMIDAKSEDTKLGDESKNVDIAGADEKKGSGESKEKDDGNDGEAKDTLQPLAESKGNLDFSSPAKISFKLDNKSNGMSSTKTVTRQVSRTASFVIPAVAEPKPEWNPRTAKFDGEDIFGCLSERDADVPTDREIYAMGLAHRLTLIKGRLTDLDRENRAVVISDEIIVEYDLLVLTTPVADNTIRTFPATRGMHSMVGREKGIFGLGNRAADAAAMKWVMDRPDQRCSPVVVYGTALEVFVAVGNLLNSGLDEQRITMAILEDEIPEIGHPTVSNAILVEVQKRNLPILWGVTVTNVQFSTLKGLIESVTIVSSKEKHQLPATTATTTTTTTTEATSTEDGKDGDHPSTTTGGTKKPSATAPSGGPQTYPCESLLCCSHKTCDGDVFTAVNDAGLVYDGGLVVDEFFRTVDPYIYAVGDFTRFSRIYKDLPSHKTFNKREMGLYVARQLLERHLDPISNIVDFTRPPTSGGPNAMARFLMTQSDTVRRRGPCPLDALPKFTWPKATYMNLPGELLLVHARLSDEIITESETIDLITGDLGSDRITVVKVNMLGRVVEIVFIGRDRVEERNLSRLVGWHESYLNSAMVGFENGRIEDWIEFFRESWTTAVLHDKFNDLANSLRSSLQMDNGAFVILENVIDSAESTTEDSIVAEARRALIGDGGSKLPELTRKIALDLGLEFLQKNKVVLTKFHVPAFDAKMT